MKKIMSLMLGMTLVIGAASMAFAQADTKKSTKKSSTKKSSTKKTTEKKTS
jgi:hypothetical protein